MMAYLLVLKGLNARQTIALEKDRTVLGRNANCDIVFPANDFAVSREHACILRIQSKFFIEDMGSRNGTYVNNQPVTARTPLKENDRIRICDFLYTFLETLPAAKPPLPAEVRAEPPGEEPEVPPSFELSISNTSHSFLESQPADKVKALIDISNNLSKTLELDPLLPKIVDSLFQLFLQADRAFIVLREEGPEKAPAPGRLIPKVIKTRRGQDESSASYSRSIVRECLRTAQAFLSDDASQDQRFKMSQSIADFRIRSVMCAPLWSEDNKAFGAIQIDTQDRSKKFTQDDLNLLMAVASQASIALDHARLHEELLAREVLRQQVELAHQVQLSFLPQQLPVVAGYEFFAHYEPAQEVGGDYYGFIPLSPQPQRLAILLGDVAGKGVPAALLMAKLSSDARFSLLSEPNLAAAITVLNDLLYQHTSQMDRFVTLAASLLDPATHRVTLVNAGHPAPLVYRRSSEQLEKADTQDVIGLPLGVSEGVAYRSNEFQLAPGDFVLVFSDGVTEAMDQDNNQLQLNAIYRALEKGPLTPRAIGERIVRIVKQHAAGRSQHDDMTLVCFGRNDE
jgi:serine phosphatase RsbU (regulator of sigma subunit)/pSer/pThr/pTyr-binding forkhead associated (FHA) protein